MFQMAKQGRATSLVDFIRKTGDPDILNAKNRHGLKLIHVAAYNARVQCVRELLTTLGDDVNATCEKGNYPIHYACMSASLPCIITLLHFGADLRALNPMGQTGLDVIPESKQASLGSLLRKAEKKQQVMTASINNLVQRYENFPTLADTETAIKGVHPVPFITDNTFTKTPNERLERGDDGEQTCYCRGRYGTNNVCVKYIPDTHAHVAKMKYSLLEEASFLAEIRHPNILLLLGMTSPPHVDYQLVFEDVHVFLHQLAIVEKFDFTSEHVIRVSRCISSALHYLHHRGYVHCALSCSNVVLTAFSTAKLCNFDNVQRLSEAKSISHLDTVHMAPDQMKGMKADAYNDVYALGLLIFECATNRAVQTVLDLLSNSKEKETCNFLLKVIPKSHEGSISTLVSSCVRKTKRRASALQIYQWTDALLGCGLAETDPFAMAPEADYVQLVDSAHCIA